MEDEEHFERLAEAEDYHIQAESILHSLQANLEVYGTNSALSGATPANVELALQYVDRCIEYFPENPKYLNLKALLLGEGLGQKDQAVALLKKAHDINPRDINVANNLKAFESSKCFIATATFGTPLAVEISVLRHWRDTHLVRTPFGRALVAAYYVISPPIARLIMRNERLRRLTRVLLKPIVSLVKRRAS